MSLVAHDESSEVLEPSEEPLDLPTSLVATKASPIFELPTSSTTSLDVRRDETNALLEKLRIERIAVVGLVADERVRQLTHEPLFDHLLDELGFVGRSASNANGERKTRAVCDCHDLGPLAALGFADAEPPFLAPAKVPSMKVSERSGLPRTCSSSARARRIDRSVPLRRHSWTRRWQVWYGRYRRGRSCHGAPVRSTQRLPSSTARASTLGRPRPSGRLRGFGNNGSMIVHCSSVRSISHYKHISVDTKRGSLKLKQFRSLAVDDFRDGF